MTRETPTPEAIRIFLKRHGITGSQGARMAYLSGGQAIRKYTGGGHPHRMSGAVWFALHAHVMLNAEQIREIEDAMRKDS